MPKPPIEKYTGKLTIKKSQVRSTLAKLEELDRISTDPGAVSLRIRLQSECTAGTSLNVLRVALKRLLKE